MVTLEASKLFSQLSAPELNVVRGIAREQTFAAGQDIFKEGDPGDCLYVVKEGLVEISGIIGTNARHVFSEVAAGEFFGEMAVLEDKTRSANAVAAKQTTVYVIARAEMLKLIER